MNVKFITLNLWQGGNLFDNILSWLESEQPDILAVQEAYNGTNPKLEKKYRSIEVLKQFLPLTHAAFAPAFLDNKPEGKIEQGNAVFSCWPISKNTITFYDRPYRTDYVELEKNFPFTPRNLQHVEITTAHTTLNVFNTQGIWDLHGEDTDRRIAMGNIIRDAVKNKKGCILTGDFNVRPHTKTVNIIRKGLTDVFDDSLTSTFNMKYKIKPGYATAVVDMIFVSPDIRILDKHVSNQDVSDHISLVAELEI